MGKDFAIYLSRILDTKCHLSGNQNLYFLFASKVGRKVFIVFTNKVCIKSDLLFSFLIEILLPKIRQDIAKNKKLNSHYYEALKKALYKPAAFFKGIILSLASSPDCSLKEAAIVSSVLIKMSVPLLHSAATLMKLAELEYSGSRSIFIKALLDKKYALPQRVIDSMILYFDKSAVRYSEKLPVLWHQSLLIFVQRYKNDIGTQGREIIISLCKKYSHDQISKEIILELSAVNLS